MTAAPLLVGCAFHDGADIDACGCPALDSPGAIAYRGLLVKARAEIARLTAELAAAREAAQRDRDVAQSMAKAAHDAEEQLAAARAVPADVEAAIEELRRAEEVDARAMTGQSLAARVLAEANLRTAIARAIRDARTAAIGAFIDQHAQRIVKEAGETWNGDDEQADAWASQIHRVLNCLRTDSDGVIHDGRATAAPATVGGLLATAPVGSIVECSFMRSHRQVRATGFESIEQRWYADGAWSDWYSLSYQFIAFQLPARLVPAAEADADPNQRGPLPTAAPRCSCTHEAGDSICDAHPSCSECGDSTSRNVDDCADHCQVCASLRRGDAITDWTATCQACKSRGPLPKGG